MTVKVKSRVVSGNSHHDRSVVRGTKQGSVAKTYARSVRPSRNNSADNSVDRSERSMREVYQYLYEQEDRDIEKAINVLKNFAF